jgi:DNA-binding NarL/FixJ family response regulator
MRHPDAQHRKPATVVKENTQNSIDGSRRRPVPTVTAHHSQNGGPSPQATDVISVLIVDDHALLREGLRQLLSLEDDLTVVGVASDGFSAQEQIRLLAPDVVLMNMYLPIIDGIAITRQITHDHPNLAVIMLTLDSQNGQLIEAMKCGARGYLLKNTSVQELVDAIRRVSTGEVVVSPALAGEIVSELRRQPESHTAQGGLHQLSERELELVRYIAAGLSNKEIAIRLAYSEKTVKNYLSIIFQKLQLRDRTQVAIFALRQGLLPAEDQPGTPAVDKSHNRRTYTDDTPLASHSQTDTRS